MTYDIYVLNQTWYYSRVRFKLDYPSPYFLTRITKVRSKADDLWVKPVDIWFKVDDLWLKQKSELKFLSNTLP